MKPINDKFRPKEWPKSIIGKLVYLYRKNKWPDSKLLAELNNYFYMIRPLTEINNIFYWIFTGRIAFIIFIALGQIYFGRIVVYYLRSVVL